MLIVALVLLALSVLIGIFTKIDLDRAVKAKESWKEQALAANERERKLRDVLRENNDRFQELSDELEDVQLALAFEKNARRDDERAINYWQTEWKSALEEYRDQRGKLASRLSTLDVRNDEIGRLLDVPEAERDQPGVLTERTRQVVEQIQALRAARDEATALLVKSQEEAADLARDREAAIAERDQLRGTEVVKDLEVARAAALEIGQKYDAATDDLAAARGANQVITDKARQLFVELTCMRAEVGAVADALRETRPASQQLQVREFVNQRGLAVISPAVEEIVRALDNLAADVRLTSGDDMAPAVPVPAVDLDQAPPARAPRSKKTARRHISKAKRVRA